MRIEQEVAIDAPVDRVWDFLMDIPVMSSCIPGVESVEQIDDTTWAGRIKQKIGPLSITFDCKITILSIDKDTLATSAEVSGRDTRLGAGVKAKMSMQLVPEDPASRLRMVTEADLSGKIAQYGHGLIKARATAMTQQFGACVNSKVATTVA